MLTTSEEHNRPTDCVCAKCGKAFVSGPWCNGYSAAGSGVHYPYEDGEYPLVTLCDRCAQSELAKDNVSRILY